MTTRKQAQTQTGLAYMKENWACPFEKANLSYFSNNMIAIGCYVCTLLKTLIKNPTARRRSVKQYKNIYIALIILRKTVHVN